MKLRIRGNTLRLRVTQSELATLMASGSVAESTGFGVGARFDYRLERSNDVNKIGALLGASAITVTLPDAVAAEWASTNAVSLRAEQPIADDDVLDILVEKDFACLVEREGEDDSDAFANPDAGKVC